MIIRIPTATGSTTQFLAGDMEWRSASASPGGADTQIQYNNGGSFGGSANFTVDDAAWSYYIGGGLADITINGVIGGVYVAGSEAVLDCKAGYAVVGDFNGAGNSTTIKVDDSVKRCIIGNDNSKPIFPATLGIYVYDTGTSTYWQWQSISGIWTGTDTGSGSLP